MRVIVAGCRYFDNYEFIKTSLDILLKDFPVTQIICGMAKGVDLCGKRYAEERDLIVAEFPADWDRHKKAAGAIRNREMANHAVKLIAFWDEKSTGTKNMIDTMKKMGKEVEVVIIPKEN